MPDPRLDIRISTTGAAQAARDIEGIGSAAGKAGQEAGKAGATARQGFNQFSKAGNDAANVINGLETASRGGIAGIFGIANAMRSLIGIVRGAVAATGPLGLLVTLLGTGLAAAMTLFGRSANSAEKSVEALTRKAQELGKVQLDQLKGQLSAIAESASDAVSEFDRLAKAAGEVDRAKTAARIAQLKARTDLSEEDRLRQISAEEQGLSDRTRGAGVASLDNAAKLAGDAQAAALAETGRIGEKLAASETRLKGLIRRRDAASELGQLKFATLGTKDPGVASQMRERMRELQGIIAEGPEVTDADIAGAKEEVAQFKGAVGAAESALSELTRAFVQAARNLDTGRQTAQQVGAAETQERAANLDVALRGVAPAPEQGPPLIEPSTERTTALEAQVKALQDANTKNYIFGGDPRINQQLGMASAALAESRADDERALSIFTAQVQASAASRRKFTRGMEKVATRANDSRP